MGWKILIGVGLMGGVVGLLLAFAFPRDNFHPEQVKGLRVIITGASSGIGEQLAYHYARLGAHVFITARRAEKLAQVVEKCRELGSEDAVFGYVAGDMDDALHPKTVVKNAIAALGSIDHLILNHAYMPGPTRWSDNPETLAILEKTLSINVLASANLAAHALPYLQQSQGSIATVNSVWGKICPPYFESYCASKFALDGFFQGLRMELKEKNVSITNCVLGAIGTDYFHELRDSVKEKFEGGIPPRTTAEPAECAYEIMKSTTSRVREMYFPSSQFVWPFVLFRDFIVAFDLYPVRRLLE